jgi:hypothetical protein
VRLNPCANHQAGNLVVISRQALESTQGVPSWQAALQNAQQDRRTGLTSDAWQRWAVMMTFAQKVPHAQAASLPLCALPPNRVRVVNLIQSVQVMLTLQFTAAGYARRLLELAALLPSGEIRQAFQIFMHTLLARRLSVGATATAQDTRHALEDAWLDPLVNRRWQRLSWHLTEAMCEQWLRRASQRGLMVGGMRWMLGDNDEPACSRAAAPATRRSRAARPETHKAYAAAASGLTKPGIARSLGSQKLAS